MLSSIFEKNIPMSGYTTFKTGGPASFLAKVSSQDEAVNAIKVAIDEGMDWIVMGAGSNMLANDVGIDKTIILFIDKSPPRILPEDNIAVSAGYPLSMLVEFMAKNGLQGMEDLAGIPGTVGGAIVGNAGAYGTSISRCVKSIRVIDHDSKISTIESDKIGFDYRTSRLKQTGNAVIEVIFKTKKEDPEILANRATLRLLDRRKKHPNFRMIPTAGSFFKNPLDKNGKRISAGNLLENAGCKNMRVGSARQWHKHANIIVTDGTSTAEDILKLANLMQRMVHDKYGIDLEREVRYI